MTAEPVLDVERLRELALACSAPEFLSRFARDSLRDASIALGHLESAGRLAKWDALRDRAHAIAGVAANVGAARVSALARSLMLDGDEVLAADWPARVSQIRDALALARKRLDETLRRIDPAMRNRPA